jgi:hypothetical protein
LVCSILLLSDTGCKNTKKEEQPAITFEIDKEFQRGPLTVHIRVDKAKLTIADTIWVEFEAKTEAGYEVKMPQMDKVLENFGIVDWNHIGNKLGNNNIILSTYRYKLEPFLSGSFDLPAFTFEFRNVNDPEDNKHELVTDPISIEVSSLLGEQKAGLKIADLEGVLTIPVQPSYGWIWGLLAAGFIVAFLFWIRWRGRQARELIRIFRPAHEIAYDRLRSLVSQDLVGAGKVKEFYERISDILRHYIEHRFNLKAPERTTEEFLMELTSVQVLNPPDQERLGEFLQHCDLVKFAKYTPTTEQIQKTFDLVKDFIETTKSDDKTIDMTEMKSDPVIEAVKS